MFDQIGPLMNEIVVESLGCSPESWTKGRLTITCDGRRIDYKLKNDESAEKAQISPELAKMCENLWVTFKQMGQPWKTAHIDFHQEGDDWNVKTEFEYGDTPSFPQVKTSPDVQSAKRPFWKFW